MPDTGQELAQDPVVYFGSSTTRKGANDLAPGFRGAISKGPGKLDQNIVALIQRAREKKDLLDVDPDVRQFVLDNQSLLLTISKDFSQPTNHEQVLECTAFNQALARDYYILIHNKAGEAQKKNASIMYEIAEILANDGNKFGQEARKKLNSARAQAGLMRFFEEEGYDVFVPNDDEIESWDVLGKTDFIVVQGNNMFFIDAKGWTNEPDGYGGVMGTVLTECQVHETLNGKPPTSVIKSMSEILRMPPESFKTKHITVYIPTVREYTPMGVYGKINDKGKSDLRNKIKNLTERKTYASQH